MQRRGLLPRFCRWAGQWPPAPQSRIEHPRPNRSRCASCSLCSQSLDAAPTPPSPTPVMRPAWRGRLGQGLPPVGRPACPPVSSRRGRRLHSLHPHRQPEVASPAPTASVCRLLHDFLVPYWSFYASPYGRPPRRFHISSTPMISVPYCRALAALPDWLLGSLVTRMVKALLTPDLTVPP